MALEIGDYVKLVRLNPRPGVPRRARGHIVRINGDWATVQLPGEGGVFEAPLTHLDRLLRAESL